MRKAKSSRKSAGGSRRSAKRSARKAGSRRLGRRTSIFSDWVNARPSYGLLSPGPGIRW